MPRPHRLARRLLLAQVVVVLTGAITFAVVMTILGPQSFLDRIADGAPGPLPEPVRESVVEAFATSMAGSLGIAAVVAMVAATVVSGVLATRIARPIEGLARAAQAIEHGHVESRAPVPGANDELLDLTTAFNTMAVRLEDTELARRRLVADLTHELRTPLSTLEGYLEGLRDGVIDPDRDTIATMTAATLRLHRLVDDMGDLSRTQEGTLDLQPHDLDLSELLDAAVAAARPTFRQEQVRLVLQLPDAAARVWADRDRLGQIVANLLANARVHSGPGSTVTVTLAPTPDRVHVIVADDGNGIAARDLPHLFDRFYRTDRSRGRPGSGLGLTIARSLARAHGGDLEASSPGPGHGATFTFTLPTPDPSGHTGDP